MVKVLTVVGARPQFVKVAAVSRILRQPQYGIQEILLHTGQHYNAELSEIFFKELEIPNPDFNLHVGSQTHGAQTGQMLAGIEKICMEQKPDWVLVFGDTNSTLAGALAAAKLHIPVAHVEAGIRSGNKMMAEELNRIMTDHISEALFCPTVSALENLKKENISNKASFVGDVMFDAALYYEKKTRGLETILDSLKTQPKNYVLVTIHRPENTDYLDRLKNIMAALNDVAASFDVIFPVHPRTKKVLEEHGLLKKASSKIQFITPVGYLDMVVLQKNSRVIITDSGGIQKEAFFYRVPCLTVRDDTEWWELVECGWNTLTPPKTYERLSQQFMTACLDPKEYPVSSYFGDGHASELIAAHLSRKL